LSRLRSASARLVGPGNWSGGIEAPSGEAAGPVEGRGWGHRFKGASRSCPVQLIGDQMVSVTPRRGAVPCRRDDVHLADSDRAPRSRHPPASRPRPSDTPGRFPGPPGAGGFKESSQRPLTTCAARVAPPRSPNGASGPMVRRCAGLQGPQGPRHDTARHFQLQGSHDMDHLKVSSFALHGVCESTVMR
jgi:hypothetical protein